MRGSREWTRARSPCQHDGRAVERRYFISDEKRSRTEDPDGLRGARERFAEKRKAEVVDTPNSDGLWGRGASPVKEDPFAGLPASSVSAVDEPRKPPRRALPGPGSLPRK